MYDVGQLTQYRRWYTVTIQKVVTSGHHERLGQNNSVKHGGANGAPLRHKLFDVRDDLFPTRGGAIWAINPYTQNSQRRISRKHVSPFEASSNILVKTVGPVCQRSYHKDVSFIQVEFTPNSEHSIRHNLPDKTEILNSGHEQVHIVGVHNQFSRGQTTK